MEELKEKYSKLVTKELERLYEISDDKEKECIKFTLRTRGAYVPFDSAWPDDNSPIEPDEPKRVLPTQPETLKPKFRNPVTPVVNFANNKNKQLQFYMVYDVILKEFGFQVAILIALLASKQRYYRQYKKLDSEGCFYLEHPRIQEMTGLSKYYQIRAMETLVEFKLLYISPKKKGTPPKKFYSINLVRYDELLEKLNSENYD